ALLGTVRVISLSDVTHTHYLDHPVSPLFRCRLRGPSLPTLFPYTTLFRSSARLPQYVRCRALGAGLQGRQLAAGDEPDSQRQAEDRKSTRLNSSHQIISYAVFCLKKKSACEGVVRRAAHSGEDASVLYTGT